MFAPFPISIHYFFTGKQKQLTSNIAFLYIARFASAYFLSFESNESNIFQDVIKTPNNQIFISTSVLIFVLQENG